MRYIIEFLATAVKLNAARKDKKKKTKKEETI